MKEFICFTSGAVGALITALFGGWSVGMGTLITFMCIDYISGLLVAGVFKKSNKTKSGALESSAGFKGLCRKCMVLFLIVVAHRMDIMLGTTYVQDAVCIGFTVNESISILENAGLMGLPVPDQLTRAIDVLKNKEDK